MWTDRQIDVCVLVSSFISFVLYFNRQVISLCPLIIDLVITKQSLRHVSCPHLSLTGKGDGSDQEHHPGMSGLW